MAKEIRYTTILLSKRMLILSVFIVLASAYGGMQLAVGLPRSWVRAITLPSPVDKEVELEGKITDLVNRVSAVEDEMNEVLGLRQDFRDLERGLGDRFTKAFDNLAGSFDAFLLALRESLDEWAADVVMENPRRTQSKTPIDVEQPRFFDEADAQGFE